MIRLKIFILFYRKGFGEDYVLIRDKIWFNINHILRYQNLNEKM